MRRFIWIYWVLIVWTPLLFAQTVTEETLQEGLVLKLSDQNRRSLLPPDPVEAALAAGTWQAPSAGAKVKLTETETGTWEKIQADSTGWFSGRSFSNSYVYFSYPSPESRIQLLEGMAHNHAFINGQPRVGNRYQYKENWEAWEPNFSYGLIPVWLNSGANDLLFKCERGQLKVKLHTPKSAALFNAVDVTLPDLIIGETIDTQGAIVVINASTKTVDDLYVQSQGDQRLVSKTRLPELPPLSVRKIGFSLRGPAPEKTGTLALTLQLRQEDGQQAQLMDTATITVRILAKNATHKRTFISAIDGSVQYYAINPAQTDDKTEPKALFLSVHGAAVEAINQAGSYLGKTWGHIVAPTNRRPYGFNWEDWGRLDALEVLDLAQKNLTIDPNRVYLTGHSMGGHGTWILGATYPDRFAAIGPSAGWLSFWSYRVRDAMPESTAIEKMLMRPTSISNTLALAPNYQQHGVYIIHGADDDNVRAEQSHIMVEHLQKFHKDFVYHEQPGAGHWWDVSDEDGTDCVDWLPLFDFFARHARPGAERIRQVKFITANPGVSASNYWLSIEAQQEQLKFSTADIHFDPGKGRFVGATENIARLALDLSHLKPVEKLTVVLDSQQIADIPWPEKTEKIWLEHKADQWTLAGPLSPANKGPHRYGTFKDAFRHRFVLVYGTRGNKIENDWALAKARYDAESFWYQGNGSVDIIADVNFDPRVEPDRNVILYGNASTNAAWKILLGTSPVQVQKGLVRVGERTLKGDNLGCLVIRPRPGSDRASVGAVAGTGIVGMRATNTLRYLQAGYAFPDCLVFSSDIFTGGVKGIKAAGFFGLDWRMENGEFAWGE